MDVLKSCVSVQGNGSEDDRFRARLREISGIKSNGLSDADVTAAETQIAAKADRTRRAGWMDTLESSAGKRYASCRLSTYHAQCDRSRAAVAAIHEYITTLPERVSAGEGVVLYGPVGTGKDHLAFAVARAAIVMYGIEVAWVRAQDWFGRARDAIDSGDSERSIIRTLSEPKILVLSDPLPPVGNLTQYQATMLYRAIEERSFTMLPTICTVNVADDIEADDRLGAQTWDRLCDRAWKIRCQWKSYRKPAREIG